MPPQEQKNKKIVVKIGTNLLRNEDWKLNVDYIKNISSQIIALKKQGYKIVIVTSGAIAAGCGELGLKAKPRDIILKQASAAVGQAILMQHYKEAFKGDKIAQLLITYDTFKSRESYLNLQNTLRKLLELDVVPIINENDPIATDEIGNSFGDNDKLSAIIAAKIEASLLVVLTVVDGLFSGKKERNVVPVVHEITSEIEKLAGKASYGGTGGMKSKLEAAKIAMEAGIKVVVANGRIENVLQKIMDAEKRGEGIGTAFIPAKKISDRKQWIKLSPAKGKVYINEGAKKALLENKNLLPVGVVKVEGEFREGEIVEIVCGNSKIAKAVSEYSSSDLKKIIGKRSGEIEKILGAERNENVTFRDRMTIL